MKKPFIFAKEITTTVPTACLIEHYQALCKAIQNKDWTEVETVKACLAENIKFGTDVPEQYRMQEVAPSVSSVIATECGYGSIWTESIEKERQHADKILAKLKKLMK